MDSINVNLEKYALPRSLLIIPTTMLLLMQTIQSGDIEQILPAASNFTIDGDNSAEVMRVQSDGNVGIGTTTPNERLEVNGHIRMTDGNEAADTVMVGNADGTASWADIATIKDGNGTDNQALSLIGNILTLENGGTIDLTSFIDNTDDQNITDLSLSGTTLSITLENGNTQTVDLSALNNSAAVTAVQSNIDAHVADDNDTSATNEIQTLTSDNNSVTLVQTGNNYDLNVSIPAQTVTSLTQQASPNQLDYKYTSENTTETTIKSSPIVGFGKVDGTGALQRGYGATVSRNSRGNYTVTLDNARPSANYTIQLTIVDSNGAGNDDYDISYSNQTTNSFVVQTGDNDNGGGDRATRDSEFMFTVIDY